MTACVSVATSRAGAPACYLAVDIGGTAIKHALLDSCEQLAGVAEIPTPRAGGRPLVDAVVGLVQRTVASHPLAGVGISTAGTLDRESRAVVFAAPTIPGYTGTAWRTLLRDVVDVPVAVNNDAVAALTGELWKGTLGSIDDVYYVTLGTGIGGARGRRLADHIHWQIEARAIGYMLREPVTGGYWETQASVAALDAMAVVELGPDAGARTLFERARHGDLGSVDTLNKWAVRVARGLTEIAIASEPRYVVIGGGVSAQGAYLGDLLAAAWQKCLPPRPLRTELRVATLANDAALYGAVYPLLVEG